MIEEMNFDDLAPIEIPTSIGGKKYVLREASGGAAVRYRSASARCLRMNDGKLSAMEGIGELEPLLISMCLFEVTERGSVSMDTPQGRTLINSWPSRVHRALYEKAKEISPGLEEKETTETIQRRVQRDTKKLEELQKDGGPEKNLLEGTSLTSG
jgi:hypothetical protein